MMDAAGYPLQISNDKAGRALDILWHDGITQRLPHALLRAACKCTVCQSRRLLAQAAPQDEASATVSGDPQISELRQVGLYGLQLIFSDGHERGIYPWSYLRAMPGAAQA